MFEVLKTEGKARRGVFTCAHGTVQTPVFMNVGTQGAIKGAVSAHDLKEIGCQAVSRKGLTSTMSMEISFLLSAMASAARKASRGVRPL